MAQNLAGYTQDEVIKAVTLIQDICKTYPNCDGCPFSHRGCNISAVAPYEWEINGGTEWKAFL